jgi:putative hydrolase of HD superfamily
MVSPDRLHAEFNSPEFDPLDGAIVKGCDELGAFVEACKSLETGINPPTLVKAVRSILKKYDGVRTGPVEWTGYFRGFADLVPERLR